MTYASCEQTHLSISSSGTPLVSGYTVLFSADTSKADC